MIKEYTITQNGSSNGNIISAPFKVKVHTIQYSKKITLGICTCNSQGIDCDNDDLEIIQEFDLPSMSSSKNVDLATTIEVLLEEKYPGNWS